MCQSLGSSSRRLESVRGRLCQGEHAPQSSYSRLHPGYWERAVDKLKWTHHSQGIHHLSIIDTSTPKSIRLQESRSIFARSLEQFHKRNQRPIFAVFLWETKLYWSVACHSGSLQCGCLHFLQIRFGTRRGRSHSFLFDAQTSLGSFEGEESANVQVC